MKKTKPSLVWLHAVDSLARIELDGAEQFVRFSESRFRRELEKLRRQEKSHPSRYWREELGFGTTRGDLLGEQFAEMEQLQQLSRYFGVILAYAALERVLGAIIKDAGRLGLVTDGKFARRKNLDFKSCARFLKRDLGTDLTRDQKNYAALNKLREVRNAIAHYGGWVHSDIVDRLKPYGYSESQRIELDQNHFYDCVKLVKNECHFVVNSYREFLQSKYDG
jgi:hypothetical protein